MVRRLSFFRPLILLAAVLLLASGCAGLPSDTSFDTGFYNAPEVQESLSIDDCLAGREIKNIIYLIGDGMGANHRYLARIAAVGTGGRLHMERLPVTGLVSTYSAGRIKTDSAAAATAMATGYKTDNKMISMLPDGSEPLTILELLQGEGMATGIIATKAVSDATPACFAAHNVHRNNHSEIARDILRTGPDIVLGGGRDHWLPSPEGGKRKDDLNLIEEAAAEGYRYVSTSGELNETESLPLLGLFAEDRMAEREPEPSLAQMTNKALELLSADDKGFFLMVEGSQIDTYSHKNKAREVIRRTLLFDEAVGTALDFARQDGSTLVVVAADHETGGLLLLDGETSPRVRWIGDTHTSAETVIHAYGPGAIEFSGIMDNTEIPKKMAALMGCPDF